MKADLHNHIYVTWEIGTCSLQKGPRSLEYLTDLAISRELDILGITSHGQHDKRFLSLQRSLTQLPKGYEAGDLGTVIDVYRKKDWEKVSIVNTRTVPTKQGDVLLIGNCEDFNDQRDIKETLKRASDLGCAIVAEHVFVKKAGGVGRKVFEENARYFDAVEISAQAPKSCNDLAAMLATETNKPLIANSDSHTPKDVGLYHTEYEKGRLLIYNSGDEFIERLKLAMQDPLWFKDKNAPLLRKAWWITVLLYDVKIRRNLGLLPPTAGIEKEFQI